MILRHKLRTLGFATLATLAGLAASSPASAAEKTVRLNSLIEKLESGATVVAPTDWAFVDMEHSPYDISQFRRTLEEMGQSRNAKGQLPATPVVRIPAEGDSDPTYMVKQVLDAGGYGIVFPRIENRAQTLRAVSAMRYPQLKGATYQAPTGKRGFGPGYAAKSWGLSVPEYMERADLWPNNPKGELLAFMLVESLDGVKNIEEIITTPGVSGIFFGHSDFGLSAGVGPARATLQPEIDQALQKVVASCKKHKVICIYAAFNDDDIKLRREQGIRMIIDMPNMGRNTQKRGN